MSVLLTSFARVITPPTPPVNHQPHPAEFNSVRPAPALPTITAACKQGCQVLSNAGMSNSGRSESRGAGLQQSGVLHRAGAQVPEQLAKVCGLGLSWDYQSAWPKQGVYSPAARCMHWWRQCAGAMRWTGSWGSAQVPAAQASCSRRKKQCVRPRRRQSRTVHA